MRDNTKKNIFVSYTTLDINVDILKKIEHVLKRHGNVYVDILHNDNKIEPQRKVFDEIAISNQLIVLTSKNIRKSKWVRLEIEKAKEKNILISYIDVNTILAEDFNL